jgi:F1F0 ATPase subunit 2
MNSVNIFLFGGLGLLVGLCHFGSLHWLSQRLVSASGPDWRVVLAVQVLRIAVLVLACWWAVGHGAWPLLTLAVGILAARVVLLRQVRRAEGNRART